MSKYYYNHLFFQDEAHQLLNELGESHYFMTQTLSSPAVTISVAYQDGTAIKVYYHNLDYLARIQSFHRQRYGTLPLGILSKTNGAFLSKNYDANYNYTGLEISHYDPYQRLKKHTVFQANNRLIQYQEHFYDDTEQTVPSQIKTFDGDTWEIAVVPS